MLHCMKLIEFFDPYLYLTIQDAINDIERGNYDNVSGILYCYMINKLFKVNCFFYINLGSAEILTNEKFF